MNNQSHDGSGSSGEDMKRRAVNKLFFFFVLENWALISFEHWCGIVVLPVLLAPYSSAICNPQTAAPIDVTSECLSNYGGYPQLIFV